MGRVEAERFEAPGPPETGAIALPLPLKGSSDTSLVERALAGEPWARAALYQRHVHRVTTVVARLLRNGPDVEDVVQDTFIQALGELDKLREPKKVESWLVGIAVHRVHRRFRRRALRRLLGLERTIEDERLESQARVEASQEARAELALLDLALDEVAPADRICWVLRHVEGYALAEVANLAGCSVATAKRRIARAVAIVDVHRGESR